MDRPIIVTLCGSTRFSDAFHEANLRETLAGKIVLSIGCDFKSDHDLVAGQLTDADKKRLDTLHHRKIDLADEVLFLNIGGYMGTSTLIEHFYASSIGKTIRYLETPPTPNFYYEQAHDVGMIWLREQQKQGRYPHGIRLINRRSWFSDDDSEWMHPESELGQ